MIKIKETKNGSKYFVTNDGIIDNNLNLYDFDLEKFKKEIASYKKADIMQNWESYEEMETITDIDTVKCFMWLNY